MDRTTMLMVAFFQIYWRCGYCGCSLLVTFTAVRTYSKLRYARIVQEEMPLTSPLEYWHYLDRPETFVRYATQSDYTLARVLNCGSIGKSDDEVGRMLEVLRFWFTKDLVRPAISSLPTLPY